MQAESLSMLAHLRLKLGEANYRVALWHFGHGWTHRRIARKLGVSREAVTQRIALAKREFDVIRPRRLGRPRRTRQLDTGRI